MKFPCDVIIHCEPNKKGTVVTMTGWNELVRCKDCKYVTRWRSEESARKFGQIYECRHGVFAVPEPDDFCSRAERKEE